MVDYSAVLKAAYLAAYLAAYWAEQMVAYWAALLEHLTADYLVAQLAAY